MAGITNYLRGDDDSAGAQGLRGVECVLPFDVAGRQKSSQVTKGSVPRRSARSQRASLRFHPIINMTQTAISDGDSPSSTVRP